MKIIIAGFLFLISISSFASEAIKFADEWSKISSIVTQVIPVSIDSANMEICFVTKNQNVNNFYCNIKSIDGDQINGSTKLIDNPQWIVKNLSAVDGIFSYSIVNQGRSGFQTIFDLAQLGKTGLLFKDEINLTMPESIFPFTAKDLIFTIKKDYQNISIMSSTFSDQYIKNIFATINSKVYGSFRLGDGSFCKLYEGNKLSIDCQYNAMDFVSSKNKHNKINKQILNQLNSISFNSKPQFVRYGNNFCLAEISDYTKRSMICLLTNDSGNMPEYKLVQQENVKKFGFYNDSLCILNSTNNTNWLCQNVAGSNILTTAQVNKIDKTEVIDFIDGGCILTYEKATCKNKYSKQLVYNYSNPKIKPSVLLAYDFLQNINSEIDLLQVSTDSDLYLQLIIKYKFLSALKIDVIQPAVESLQARLMQTQKPNDLSYSISFTTSIKNLKLTIIEQIKLKNIDPNSQQLITKIQSDIINNVVLDYSSKQQLLIKLQSDSYLSVIEPLVRHLF